MANKFLVVLVISLIIGMGSFFLLLNSQEGLTGGTVDNSEDVKTFVLDGENFKFIQDGVDNPEIKVKEGDKVRIEFTSVGGFHDWVVDEFNAATERVNEGGSTFVEFIADKKGTYEYYCSVGQHRSFGMKGVFVVE